MKFLFVFLSLAFVIYGRSVSNEFVMDDEEQILLNQKVHSIKNIPQFFTMSTMNGAGSDKLGGIYFKPLMMSAYALLWQIAPNSPVPFHLFQITLHAVNSYLIYLMFCFLLPISSAFFAALIFLVHPMNTEAVVYIADLQDVLFLFFGLLSLIFVFKRQLYWSAFFILLSLLSKESGALFLFLALVVDRYFCHSRHRGYRLSVFGVALGYLFLRFFGAGLTHASDKIVAIGQVSIFGRMMTSTKAIFHYFADFVFPLHLTGTQDWVIHDVSTAFLYFVLIALIAASLGFIYFRHKQQSSLFFLFWLLIGLGLHSQIIIPLDGTVADRWFYFPMVGLLGFLFSNFKKQYIPLVWVCGFAFAVRSYSRSLDWQDGFTLYAHDVRVDPESYILQNNLGVELFRRGLIKEAQEHFKLSIEYKPIWTTNWNNLGATFERENKLSEAQDCYQKSIANGDYYLAFENLAGILIKQNKLSEAKAFLEEQALVKFPKNDRLLSYYNYLKANSP